jgi:predicted AlkP superfamily pyrophosphatase or phosphodiesterase
VYLAEGEEHVAQSTTRSAGNAGNADAGNPGSAGSAKRVLHIGLDGMNLPLLRKFAAEGILPTFSALMARGSVNRVMPAIPAWTPTNWATMATGATAGTHGLGGWSVRRRSIASTPGTRTL